MNNLCGKILKLAVVVSLIGTVSGAISAQTTPPAKPSHPAPWPATPRPVWPGVPAPPDGVTTERALTVDPNMNLTLCVVEGRVTVNGWGRPELRVLVREGSPFVFKVKEKGKGDQPVWVTLVGTSSAGVGKAFPGCVTGEAVEVDLPTGATLDLRGQETRTTVDTVKKATIKNVGGNISVRNVSDGITASTYEGDITVEESKGSMQLDTTSGNIIAFSVGPSEIGDTFRVKTNSGVVSLQRLEHRQVEVGSISGAVYYSGPIQPAGAYSFGTNNGTVRLFLPNNTNCMINATYGGSFASELPFKRGTEDVRSGPVRSVNGTLGSGGDALVRLTNNSGGISIRKLP
ncbi:MAG: DUF4097 family beta strand repeat protein [Acidobacteria bacterium]|nr:DUF4097 family beta strand repeat protein [Acidobacteriota bacterium]